MSSEEIEPSKKKRARDRDVQVKFVLRSDVEDEDADLEFGEKYGEYREEGMPFIHVAGDVTDAGEPVGDVKMCVYWEDYPLNYGPLGDGFNYGPLGDADYTAETWDVYNTFFTNIGDPTATTSKCTVTVDNASLEPDPTNLCIIQELNVDASIAVDAVRRLLLAIHCCGCWFSLLVYPTYGPNAWAFVERGFQKERDWLYAMPIEDLGFSTLHGYGL